MRENKLLDKYLEKIQKRRPLRFLVVRTDRIGDVILSMPVLTMLKQSYSSPYVAMLLQPYASDVITGHPDVDQVIVDDEKGNHSGWRGFLKLRKAIRRKNFDAIILLHPTLRLALLGFCAGIAVRVGTGYRLYSIFFNRKVFSHRKNSIKHELDLNLELVNKIGVTASKIEFKFHVPENSKEKIDHFLTEFGLQQSDKFVVIHPGSGGSAPSWPLENFGDLAAAIISRLKLPVILTGSEKEKQQVELVWHRAKKKPFSLVGCLNIKDLAALLQRCQVMIANSTGPLHLANALGTEVVGLYCPLRPFFPERWGPYGRMDSVIMPPVMNECLDSCCMDKISVAQVYEMVERKAFI